MEKDTATEIKIDNTIHMTLKYVLVQDRSSSRWTAQVSIILVNTYVQMLQKKESYETSAETQQRVLHKVSSKSTEWCQ